MSTHTVRNEGAEGPLLLLIPGRGGSGARFAVPAERLSPTYDRRGPDAGFDLGGQARDATAVARLRRFRPAAETP